MVHSILQIVLLWQRCWQCSVAIGQRKPRSPQAKVGEVDARLGVPIWCQVSKM